MSFIMLIYMTIGVAWFLFVMTKCILKKGTVSEGTIIGCIVTWPITVYGYLSRIITGKRNEYDPLDLTDFKDNNWYE